MKNEITCTESAYYHHIPHYSTQPEIEGLTVRQALKVLRGVYWGDIGGMCAANLSDGTLLEVRNYPTSDGGELCGTQYARRFEWSSDTVSGERTIRNYSL